MLTRALRHQARGLSGVVQPRLPVAPLSRQPQFGPPALTATAVLRANATRAFSAAANKPIPNYQIELTRQDGTKVPGYAFGEQEDEIPTVVMLQEWWGIDAQVMEHAGRLADSGYRVIVPDLYRGKLGVDAEEASHLMGELDWEAAIEDVRTAVQAFADPDGCKVGVVGFCMGGALSVASAVKIEELAACVCFYGVNTALADPAEIKIPLQGHFGELDTMEGFSDPGTAYELEAAAAKAAVEHEIFVYPGVGHAFLNDTEESIARKAVLGQTGGDAGAIHDQEACELAWTRMVAFFDQHLKS